MTGHHRASFSYTWARQCIHPVKRTVFQDSECIEKGEQFAKQMKMSRGKKRERESSALKGDGLNLLYNTLYTDQGLLLAQSTFGEARASGLTLTNMKFLVSS